MNEIREEDGREIVVDGRAFEELLAAIDRLDRNVDKLLKLAKQSHPVVTFQPYYSVAEVSKLLGISRNLVNELADRRNDPLLFRYVAFKDWGKLIAHNDLVEWVNNNTVYVRDRRRGNAGDARDGN